MSSRLGRHLAVFVATGGYVGYLPGAPGTAGAALGLLLGWSLASCQVGVQIGVAVALFLLGVVSAGYAERWLDARDHQAIVIDEILGMFLALLALPFQAGLVIAGFLLFRALDILKPPPVAKLEQLPRGWGVVCDDVAAGILTNLVLQGIRLAWR